MTIDGHEVFKELEPPPGGSERFAQRLGGAVSSAPKTHRWRALVLAGAACSVVALVAAVALLRKTPEPVSSNAPIVAIYDAPAFDRLLRRPPKPAELTVTLDEEPASVAEIATTNPKVRIYRID